jgi:hypothetical protein
MIAARSVFMLLIEWSPSKALGGPFGGSKGQRMRLAATPRMQWSRQLSFWRLFCV